MIDPDEATELLATVLPDLDRDRLRQLLSTDAKFAYIKREITPRQQQAMHKLGIPGIGFRVENRRFYPGGPAAAHVLGTVNIDNQGIAGIEKYIDGAFLNDLQAAGFATGARAGAGAAVARPARPARRARRAGAGDGALPGDRRDRHRARREHRRGARHELAAGLRLRTTATKRSTRTR